MSAVVARVAFVGNGGRAVCLQGQFVQELIGKVLVPQTENGDRVQVEIVPWCVFKNLALAEVTRLKGIQPGMLTGWLLVESRGR